MQASIISNRVSNAPVNISIQNKSRYQAAHAYPQLNKSGAERLKSSAFFGDRQSIMGLRTDGSRKSIQVTMNRTGKIMAASKVNNFEKFTKSFSSLILPKDQDNFWPEQQKINMTMQLPFYSHPIREFILKMINVQDKPLIT